MDGVVAALLLDIVGSRGGDRVEQHAHLSEALPIVNAEVSSLSPLRFTVGDELQGLYAGVGSALTAAYALRLRVAPKVDLRAGIGVGEVHVIDAAHGIEDGSAWWRAREAVESVKRLAKRPGHRHLRTAIADGQHTLATVTVALTGLIDAHLARLRPGTHSTLRGLVDGLDNTTIAAREGISASANSQRVINNDLWPLAEALAALRRLP